MRFARSAIRQSAIEALQASFVIGHRYPSFVGTATPPDHPRKLHRAEVLRTRHLIDDENSDAFRRESRSQPPMRLEELARCPPSELVRNLQYTWFQVDRPVRGEDYDVECVGVNQMRYASVEARAVPVGPTTVGVDARYGRTLEPKRM